MITKIYIDGFKSFRRFEMEFAPLTVVAGTNASGKSNLFDALRLLSRLAATDLKTAFNDKEVRGSAGELFTQYDEDIFAEEMYFAVELLVNKRVKDNWGGDMELKYTRLRYELKIKRTHNQSGFEDLNVVYERLVKLNHDEDNWVNLHIPTKLRYDWRPKVPTGKRGIPYIDTEEINGVLTIVVPQDGRTGNKKNFPALHATQTVLSSFNSIDFPHVLAAREEMISWKFLELNTEDLREPTRQDVGIQDKITTSGKNLAAALFRIQLEDSYILKSISRKLAEFLPDFTEVIVENDKANRQYIIKLKSQDGRYFSSRVLSEGTLRLLTLCILLYDDTFDGLLCFEEPENGIHPYRIKAMAQLLKELSVDFNDKESPLRQVIVNTHSPILVAEMIRWEQDVNVSIVLSELQTVIDEFGGKRRKLRCTRITPVMKEAQTEIHFTEEERKLTILEVKKYLETADTEAAFKKL